MLKEAKELLGRHYKNSLDKVRDSEYCAMYAKEKMMHSMQVFEMGEYFYDKELNGRSSEFKEIALTAVLLHDIGRFSEIIEIYKAQKAVEADHNILGYEILKNIPAYSDIRIVLPIKHHGHMIEDFYNDEAFTAVKDEKLKGELVDIIKLVRDADKMANFGIFIDIEEPEEGVVVKLNISQKPIGLQYAPPSDVVLETFFSEKPVLKKDMKSGADELLGILAWVFDLNYKSSYEMYLERNLLRKHMRFLRLYINDENLLLSVEKKIKNYINKKI